MLSCEKLFVDDCFKSTGEITIERRESSDFENIILEDNINLILTQGNECAIMVEAGKNLLESIKTDISGGICSKLIVEFKSFTPVVPGSFSRLDSVSLIMLIVVTPQTLVYFKGVRSSIKKPV